MLAPLQLDRIQEAVRTPQGLLDLAAVLLCFGVAYLIARRVYRRLPASEPGSRLAQIGAGSVNRLIFPLAALVLLWIVRGALRTTHEPAFFGVAIPLAVALALIRMFVYGLHALFGPGAWSSGSALGYTVWGGLLLYYLGILQQIGDTLADVKLPIGKSELSVLDLGRDALAVVVAIVLALWVSSVLEQRLMRTGAGDTNVRAVLAKVLRAVMLLIAVLVALSVTGIDLTVLSVFGGALGVGIGLGLQKLASNYIAGFTILLDRSVRLGDMVTVDTRHGIVTKATSRYVVVRGLDGVEAIVPNEIMVTTTVLNHSYSTPDVKVGIPLQVSYDSDLELAMRLMVEVANRHARVLRQSNPPVVLIQRFADSGIDLELGVWIRDPQAGQGNLRSELYLEIWRAFREHGIRIPYPQREVRLIGGGPEPNQGSTTGDRPN
ncbi:MAG TPA: mechanosensitive ion channel domain-containing protein [Casimicrobiaceae bacterium]|nr:mechanosensitive ion channel domain-containing protein [Casimicrobiaceae bacterium]